MCKQYYFKRHELLHDKLSSEHKLLTPEALEAPNRDRLLPLFFVVYHNRVKPIKKYTKDFGCGTQRNQPWTYQEALFILTSFYSAGKHQGRCWRRKDIITCYIEFDPTCSRSDLPGKKCLLAPPWHDPLWSYKPLNGPYLRLALHDWIHT